MHYCGHVTKVFVDEPDMKADIHGSQYSLGIWSSYQLAGAKHEANFPGGD